MGQPPVAPAVREASRAQVRADILMTGDTLFTGATAEVKGTDNPIALFVFRHLWPDLFHHATEFMADDLGQLQLEADPGPVPGPDMPVAATDAVGLDPDDGIV